MLGGPYAPYKSDLATRHGKLSLESEFWGAEDNKFVYSFHRFGVAQAVLFIPTLDDLTEGCDQPGLTDIAEYRHLEVLQMSIVFRAIVRLNVRVDENTIRAVVAGELMSEVMSGASKVFGVEPEHGQSPLFADDRLGNPDMVLGFELSDSDWPMSGSPLTMPFPPRD